MTKTGYFRISTDGNLFVCFGGDSRIRKSVRASWRVRPAHIPVRKRRYRGALVKGYTSAGNAGRPVRFAGIFLASGYREHRGSKVDSGAIARAPCLKGCIRYASDQVFRGRRARNSNAATPPRSRPEAKKKARWIPAGLNISQNLRRRRGF